MDIRRYNIHLVLLTFLLSACASTAPVSQRFRTPDATPPQDLTADTADTSAADGSLTGNREQNVAETGAAGPTQDIAGGGNVAVGRTDLLGGWKVAAGSDNCELFMSLTGWAGGYRATTRGCSSELLANVQAWNLNEQEVILINGGGETIARLFATSKLRFNGQTEDGIGVTVFR
jgi:hypothetical protein